MQAPFLASAAASLFAMILLPFAFAQAPEPEEVDWPNFQFEEPFPHSPFMTHITHAGDGSGRLFIVEKTGHIQVFQPNRLPASPFATNKFLSIPERVFNGPERGLFSIAFAPDFKTSGQFYVNYTRRPDGATVISRFTVGANTNLVDPSTEQIILLISQPAANHNGGQIAFGPDGYLYIGMGDGGGQGDPNQTAQNPLSLLGKILRIDVSGSSTNYSIPPSNPFAGRTDILPEIWASGLRNPWRFSFDRLTGDLFIADVGELRQEEINFQPATSAGGENYGWSLYEGILPFKFPTNTQSPTNLTFAIGTNPRALGRSITGGHVVRTPPTERSHGVYIFSDYLSGRVGALKKIGTNWIQVDFGIYSNVFRRPLQLTSFGEDEQGNLYALESGGTGNNIYRVVDRKQVVTPIISKRGMFTNEQSVTLSTLTPGTRIHYTLDGSQPSAESPSVASGEAIIVAQSGTLRARGYRSDLEPSPVASAIFNFFFSLHLRSPQTVSVTNGTPLVLEASTTNVVIRYTLDGSRPTDNSPVYENPVALEGNQTVRVLATRLGWQTLQMTNYFGRLIPEWVTIQTYAGGGPAGTLNGPARSVNFSRPFPLALMASGELFVGDTGNRAVRRIATNGNVTTVPLGDIYPTALYVDGAGAMYIAAYHSLIRAAPGQPTSLHLTGNWVNSPSGLAMDSQGRFLVTSSGSAFQATPRETVNLFFPPDSPIDGAWAVTSSPDGTICWTGAKGIFTFDAQNGRQSFAGSASFDYPNGHSDGPRLSARFGLPATFLGYTHKSLTSDAFTNLYVADGSVVRKIDAAGTVRTLIERTPLESATKIGLVGGIAVHPNGDIFVTDFVYGKIKRISPDVDRDSIPDSDERAPFTVGTHDGTIDTDSDGSNNSLEYLGGTDPLDASSIPALRGSLVANGIQLSWTGTNPRGDLTIEQSQDATTWSPTSYAFSGNSIVVPTPNTSTFLRVRID